MQGFIYSVLDHAMFISYRTPLPKQAVPPTSCTIYQPGWAGNRSSIYFLPVTAQPAHAQSPQSTTSPRGNQLQVMAGGGGGGEQSKVYVPTQQNKI